MFTFLVQVNGKSLVNLFDFDMNTFVCCHFVWIEGNRIESLLFICKLASSY